MIMLYKSINNKIFEVYIPPLKMPSSSLDLLYVTSLCHDYFLTKAVHLLGRLVTTCCNSNVDT